MLANPAPIITPYDPGTQDPDDALLRRDTGPKSAFVSSGYEHGILPRLLFLSLDSGSGDRVDGNRLPAAVRQYEEFDRSFAHLAKHKHWYRTHELAWYFLRRFEPALEIGEARRWFANSAKHADLYVLAQNKIISFEFKYVGSQGLARVDECATQGNRYIDAGHAASIFVIYSSAHESHKAARATLRARLSSGIRLVSATGPIIPVRRRGDG
jgi:hypothetical protein